MFESYSKQAFAEAKASLKILDENIIYDFGENTPEGIPLDREWQGDGLLDLMFNSEKKRLAKKRVDFNAGVMTTVCLNHFDGNSKDLEKFCVKAIKATVFSGSKVASDFKKAFNYQTARLRIGLEALK